MTALKPRVLCVDDEAMVLEALKVSLRLHCTLTVSTDPLEALKLVEAGEFLVVVSDMRMPRMSGAEFLTRVRETSPESQRILLTGYADLESCIQVVNQGQIFRFLTKPCPAAELVAAIRAAAEQHRLLRAEKELLDKTLKGSVSALTEALALARPDVYGRSARVRQVAVDVAEAIGLQDTWQLEVAAMLSSLGFMSLPDETSRKVFSGAPLTDDEAAMVGRAHDLTTRLLERIPRLEPVQLLLKDARSTTGQASSPAGEVLRAVMELHRLDDMGTSPEQIMIKLAVHTPGPVLVSLEALALRSRLGVRTVAASISELRAGMTLIDDVIGKAGALLVTRGQRLTETLLERIRNVHTVQGVREPIAVRLESGRSPIA